MIRRLSPVDYDYIISNLNDWWGGRNVTDMLPRLFFDHFHSTSFVFVEKEIVVGFVVGFISRDNPEIAYIHFTGVDPKYRKQGVATQLYRDFISQGRSNGCRYVKCVTSPSNTDSLAYHHKLGFRAKEYDDNGQCVAISNYDGAGNHRVLLTLEIG